jgi:hypothetical protein
MVRVLPVGIVALLACATGDETVELEVGAVTTVNGCSVLLWTAHKNGLALHDSCEETITDPQSPRWMELGGYLLGLGDCTRLGRRYYCVQSIDPPVLKASFETQSESGYRLRRIE